MTTFIYKFPPVSVVGATWPDRVYPVQISRSALSGYERRSGFGRARRYVDLSISSLAGQRDSAGLLHMLSRHLQGVHCVRLYSHPVNWYLDDVALDGLRNSTRLNWTNGGAPLNWTNGGQPLYWFTGQIIAGEVTLGGDGYTYATLQNLPPNRTVVRAGDYLAFYTSGVDGTGSTTQAVTTAQSDASGQAKVKCFDTITPGSYPRVSVGSSETGIFRIAAEEADMQTTGGNWLTNMRFRETFTDEIGTYAERDPW